MTNCRFPLARVFPYKDRISKKKKNMYSGILYTVKGRTNPKICEKLPANLCKTKDVMKSFVLTRKIVTRELEKAVLLVSLLFSEIQITEKIVSYV